MEPDVARVITCGLSGGAQDRKGQPEVVAKTTAHINSATESVGTPDEQEPELDRGYAWLILALMFLLNSIISGSSRVYGLVYAKQVAIGYYDREMASWPIATASTVENLAGILTPALAPMFSWRQLELLSAVLFIISNLGAYFSDSLPLDILCLGVSQGLALSIHTVLSLAINNDYFERYRTTAYGIAMSGSTCGVLYLMPLVSWLLETYDNFRLVYLALAAVFSMNILLVMFIRPRRRLVQIKAVRLPVHKDSSRKVSRLEQHLERKSSIASVSDLCKSHNQTNWSRKCSTCRESSAQAAPALSVGPEVLKTRSAALNCTLSLPTTGCAGNTNNEVEQANRKLSDKLAQISQEHQKKLVGTETTQTNIDIVSRTNSIQRNLKSPTTPEMESEHESKFLAQTVKRLVCLPYLHCVWIMLALYYLISRVFIIILVDFADDHGLTPDESHSLLNYWSLGEVCGRILLGSFIDLRWLSVKNCIALTCSLLAMFISLMVLWASYYVYAVCSTLIAALVSLEYMLINVLIIEYIGKCYVTSCYSIAAFLSSLVLFARPTMIGFFRDNLGSYDGLLILLAAVASVYALMFALLEPLLVRAWPKCKQTR